MNSATSSILNVVELLNRVDDDYDLLVEVFDIFRSAYPAHLRCLSAAVRRQDAHEAETESHALKGMLLNLSAERAASAAVRLETLGREERFEGASVLLQRLESEIELLLAQMDACTSELRP